MWHLAIFDEANRMGRKRIHPGFRIVRMGIQEIANELSLEIPIQVGNRYYMIPYYLNKKWSVERNAWEICNAVYGKINQGRYV